MIVQLNGGLGNQLFQYAFGRALSSEHKVPLFFNKSDLDCGRRHYALDSFNVSVKFKAPGAITHFRETQFNYDPQVHTADTNAYFVGYWQTEKYFHTMATTLRQEITLKTQVSTKTAEVGRQILLSPESTFVHVRRSDYLTPHTSAYHGNLTMDYYLSAMKYINDETTSVANYFVFSDDPSWCRQNFPDCQIVDHNLGKGEEVEDLYLMSLCKNAIIANSSFSWWGAWLGDTKPDRICIGPKKWFSGANLNTEDILPKRWVTRD
jgi:Glycosyl transferase family 11